MKRNCWQSSSRKVDPKDGATHEEWKESTRHSGEKRCGILSPPSVACARRHSGVSSCLGVVLMWSNQVDRGDDSIQSGQWRYHHHTLLSVRSHQMGFEPVDAARL